MRNYFCKVESPQLESNIPAMLLPRALAISTSMKTRSERALGNHSLENEHP